MAETVLLVLRHAETTWNCEGRIQGYNSDSPLTEAGHAQARALARRLAGEGIDALYTSDLGRTRQTVAPIEHATGLRVSLDGRLRERNYGVFEGLTYAQVQREFPDEFARLMARDPHFAPQGGESAAQFRDRIAAALVAIAEQCAGRRAAVMTHGGVLGMLYRLALDIPLGAQHKFTLHNASVNRFHYERGAWRLLDWGDVSHLGETSLDDH